MLGKSRTSLLLAFALFAFVFTQSSTAYSACCGEKTTQETQADMPDCHEKQAEKEDSSQKSCCFDSFCQNCHAQPVYELPKHAANMSYKTGPQRVFETGSLPNWGLLYPLLRPPRTFI